MHNFAEDQPVTIIGVYVMFVMLFWCFVCPCLTAYSPLIMNLVYRYVDLIHC